MSTRDGLSETGAETTPADDTRVQEPCGLSQEKPEPDGHSLGKPEPDGHTHSLGETEPDGHSLGEGEFGLPKQGETEPGRPNQEETKPSSRDQEESETAQTGVDPDLATKGQYSGLGVTEPATDVSGKIGKGQASSPTIFLAYSSRISLVCGILQIALGVVAVGLAIGLISFWEKTHYAQDGIGIVGGALFMVAGILGIISGRTRQRLHITTCMVLSIIAAVFSGFLPVFTVVHGAFSHKIWHGFAAFLCAITAVSFLEMVVSIVQSVMCCRVTCCATRPSTYKSAGISYTADSLCAV